MKIGVVTPRYPPNVAGGGELSAQLLVENLRQQGHNVEVLSFDKKNPEDPEYVHRKDAFSNRADLLNLQGFSAIKDFAQDKDVIHSYNSVFHPSISRLQGVKTFATLNNYIAHPNMSKYLPQEESSPVRKLYESTYLRAYTTASLRLMKGIDSFIALSTDVKAAYSQFLDPNKIEVIPNMYDPDFPNSKGIDTRSKEILFVGSLHPHKGVMDLLNQMPELEDYTLRVVGDGPQRKELESRTEDLDLNDKVIFEGRIPNEEIPQAYERAGWFVHLGRWAEPFGRTILESMQMETPVIATNRGGPKDVLPQNQLVEKAAGLNDKLSYLDRHQVVKDQNEIITDYSPSSVVDKILDIYRS